MNKKSEEKASQRRKKALGFHPVRGWVKGEDLPTWDKINIDSEEKETESDKQEDD